MNWAPVWPCVEFRLCRVQLFQSYEEVLGAVC